MAGKPCSWDEWISAISLIDPFAGIREIEPCTDIRETLNLRVSEMAQETLAELFEDCHVSNATQGLQDAIPPPPPPPPPDKAKLEEQRKTLLARWEEVTGGKRSHLYSTRTRKSPLIHRTQFYLWLHGDLSPASRATRRLENYLKQCIAGRPDGLFSSDSRRTRTGGL
jgi:hypothetical protein